MQNKNKLDFSLNIAALSPTHQLDGKVTLECFSWFSCPPSPPEHRGLARPHWCWQSLESGWELYWCALPPISLCRWCQWCRWGCSWVRKACSRTVGTACRSQLCHCCCSVPPRLDFPWRSNRGKAESNPKVTFLLRTQPEPLPSRWFLVWERRRLNYHRKRLWGKIPSR